MLHMQNPNILMSDHSEDEVEEDQTISSLALSDSSSPVIASDDGTDMELSDDLDDNYTDDNFTESIPSEDVDLAGVTEKRGEMLSYKLVGDNLISTFEGLSSVWIEQKEVTLMVSQIESALLGCRFSIANSL